MKKAELLKDFENKIGEMYFQLLTLASLLEMIHEEADFPEKIQINIESLLNQIRIETDKILEEEIVEAKQ